MADQSGEAREAVAAVTQYFVSEGTLSETLLRVAELASKAAHADFAGITMLVEGKVRTGVFTDPTSPELDHAQYETGDGPCIQSFRDQATHRIDDTHDDRRWEAFASAAAAAGIRSTLSLPLSARGEAVGALNLYSSAVGNFSERTVEDLETFTRQAAFVLVNSRVYWDVRALNENLNQAMRSRSTIDYAVGILMASGGRSPDEAFQVLARASQRENRKLRDIAADIVQRAESSAAPPGEPEPQD